MRLESSRTIGPGFQWASVGLDCVTELSEEVGLAVKEISPIGKRVVASLATG